MRRIMYLCALVIPFMVKAQPEAIWMLGAGSLDFNTNPPGIQKTKGPIFSEAAASVCDADGRLLFYTDGSRVWTQEDVVMPNGASLLDIGIATGSCTQGACITPVPGRKDQYYIFSLSSVEFGENRGRLYYSKVDMQLNNGKGDIVNTEKGILMAQGLHEKMTPVIGDQCNVWIVVRSHLKDEYQSFEVTMDGVRREPVISEVGLINFSQHMLGTLVPSPDGRKMLSSAAHPGGGGVELLDFNPFTGQLSNPKLIEAKSPVYSACFSPDQTKIYTMNYLFNSDINQYDITVAEPPKTKTLIKKAEYTLDKIKLAQDGKIYFKGNGRTLDAIEAPNLPGVLCGYKPDAFVFDVLEISGALPNHVPIFRQDKDVDTTLFLESGCWATLNAIQGNTSGWGHIWNDGSTGPVFTATAPGVYWLNYYTSPCQLHTDTFIVGFPHGRLPKVTITDACKGKATGALAAQPYAGDTVLYNYTWYNAQNVWLGSGPQLSNLYAGTYQVHIKTAQCDTQLTFTIKESDYKAAFEADTLACAGTSVSFYNQSDPYYTGWNWDFGDGSASTQYSSHHAYALPGVYAVRLVTMGPLCSDTFSGTILVDAPIPSFRLYVDRDTLCQGEYVTLHYNTDSTLVQYHWQLQDQYYRSTRDTFLQHAFDEPGLQILKLTAELRVCAEQSLTQSIFVAPIPRVHLGRDTVLCLKGSPILLSDRAAQRWGDHYLWSTGATTPELLVRQPDYYQLRITNRYGCSASDGIEVRKDCYIDIPNAFTPDGDGINDYFFPCQQSSRGIKDLHFRIWDRWGQLLFETRALNGRGWDGKRNGLEQAAGTYVYQMKVEYENGQTELLQGNVTLLR